MTFEEAIKGLQINFWNDSNVITTTEGTGTTINPTWDGTETVKTQTCSNNYAYNAIPAEVMAALKGSDTNLKLEIKLAYNKHGKHSKARSVRYNSSKQNRVCQYGNNGIDVSAEGGVYYRTAPPLYLNDPFTIIKIPVDQRPLETSVTGGETLILSGAHKGEQQQPLYKHSSSDQDERQLGGGNMSFANGGGISGQHFNTLDTGYEESIDFIGFSNHQPADSKKVLKNSKILTTTGTSGISAGTGSFVNVDKIAKTQAGKGNNHRYKKKPYTQYRFLYCAALCIFRHSANTSKLDSSADFLKGVIYGCPRFYDVEMDTNQLINGHKTEMKQTRYRVYILSVYDHISDGYAFVRVPGGAYYYQNLPSSAIDCFVYNSDGDDSGGSHAVTSEIYNATIVGNDLYIQMTARGGDRAVQNDCVVGINYIVS